jgi:mono/diheme cytochrome c family protein
MRTRVIPLLLVLASAATPARARAGSDLFNGGSCVACHAVGGHDTGRRAPDLSDAEWLHSPGDIAGIRHTIFWGVQKADFRAVTPRPFEMNPEGGMHLDREQLWAIASYVWTLSRPETSDFVARQQRFLDLARLGFTKEAVALFQPAESASGRPATLPERGLNALGYELLRRGGNPEDPIAIFRLNADLHPDSWNVWDSLGEALAGAGKTREAIDSYEKSLRLNPKNDNARKALETLRQRG